MDTSEYFTCPICQEVPEPSRAIQCRGCRTVYCQTCVEAWSNQGGHCPNCRESHGYDVADKAIQRVLGETVVECPYNCGQTTTKSELRDHCRLCPCKDDRFDFTTVHQPLDVTTVGRPELDVGGAPARDTRAGGGSARNTAACAGPSRTVTPADGGPPRHPGSDQDQEQCEAESGFGQGMLLAAAVGGALIGLVGGVVGSWVASSVKKKKDK